MNPLLRQNDGSNLRLVRERSGVLGRHPWYHLQGNQCVGLRHYLAHRHDHFGHYHPLAETYDPPAFPGE